MRCNCLNCDLLQGQLPIPEPATMAINKIRLLGIGLLLSGGFSIVEWTAGWWSHSLTLVTDAGHMLLDCFALSLSLLATWLAQLATRQSAYLGYQRAETLAALANGVGLAVLAIWAAWEAVDRFQHSHPAVVSEVMLVTAIVGLGVNAIAASLLHHPSHHDLNIRGAFLHILADAASSVGVILAAVLIWIFHWNWADEAISLFIAGMIGMGSLPLIRASLQALCSELVKDT